MKLFYLFYFFSIISYLFNPLLGFILSLSAYIYIYINKKNSFIEKTIYSLILSIPTYNISILGDYFHHILSWTSFFLVLFIFYCINIIIKNKSFEKNKSFFGIIIIFIIIIISNLYKKNVLNSMFNVFQVVEFIIPIYLCDLCKKDLKQKIEIDFFSNCDKCILLSSIVTAFGTILQYILFNKFNINLGEITLYPDRKCFDFLIKAYSVLSLYLAIGGTLSLNLFFKERKVIYIFILFLIIVAIAINSSRTGLVALLIVCCYFLLKNLKYKKNFPFYIILIFCGLFIIFPVIKNMLESRGSSLLDSNSRFETYKYSLSLIFSNFNNFLFGSGLSLDNYTYMIAHNSILETLLSTGIIVTIIILLWFYKFYKKNYKSKYIYLVTTVLIGSMFITNFQGNLFILIYIFLCFIESQSLNQEVIR